MRRLTTQELAANPDLAEVGVTRLAPFASWCTTNNVPCYLGEYGIPNNDPRWLTVLNNFLTTLDHAETAGHVLGGGRVMGDGAHLLVQPALGAAFEQFHDRRGAVADLTGTPAAKYVGDGVVGR